MEAKKLAGGKTCNDTVLARTLEKDRLGYFANLAVKSKVAMRREHIVNQVREILHKAVPAAKAILYGSEARGDAGEDSDIDLLVLLDGDVLTLKDQEAVAGPLYELELRTGVTISPTITLKKLWYNRPFKTPFYVNVMNEGIEL